jgi:hypothetical protein
MPPPIPPGGGEEGGGLAAGAWGLLLPASVVPRLLIGGGNHWRPQGPEFQTEFNLLQRGVRPSASGTSFERRSAEPRQLQELALSLVSGTRDGVQSTIRRRRRGIPC